MLTRFTRGFQKIYNGTTFHGPLSLEKNTNQREHINNPLNN